MQAIAAETASAHAEAFYQTAEFWVAIAFAVFIVLVFKKIRGALNAALDKHGAEVENRLEEAHRLREEAHATLAEYKRKQRDAMKEADDIIGHAREEAERFRADADKELVAALERRRQAAVDKIAQAEAQAVQQVRDLAVDVAIAATRQVIAEQLQGAQGDTIIDKTIQDLPDKLH